MSDDIPQGLDEAFEQALDAQREHLKIARSLVAKGLKILSGNVEGGNGKKELDVDEQAKAAAMVDRGAKMETRAHEEIRKLIRERPR